MWADFDEETTISLVVWLLEQGGARSLIVTACFDSGLDGFSGVAPLFGRLGGVPVVERIGRCKWLEKQRVLVKLGGQGRRGLV